LRKGERSSSYKGHPCPQVFHTKFTLTEAGAVASSGQFNWKINSLQDVFQSGTIDGATYTPPDIFPAWYHQFLNTYLYNNYSVYGITITIDVIASADEIQNYPVVCVWFEPSEQPETSITNMDQALMMPGVKSKILNSYDSGYRNTIRMKRHFDLVDYMGNAFDVSYTGTYNGVITNVAGNLNFTPTNGLYMLFQFYDMTTGELIDSGNTLTYNVKIVFDVSLFGFKYVPIT